MTTEEGWHVTDDGKRLYTKIWKPQVPTRAKLVFVHGFSDHCNAYYTLFPTLAGRGILVITFDQRGWGRSVDNSSQKGLTGPTSLVLSDLSSILVAQLPSPVPLFLMGHSMGGAEVLTYGCLGPPNIRTQIAGYLAEAPLLALHESIAPSKFTTGVGRLAGRILPHRKLVQRLDEKTLSRDLDVQRSFVEDELCHDTGTLEGIAGMLERGEHLLNGRVKFTELGGETLKVWVSHGTQDRVTSCDASRRWVEGLTVHDKEFKAYDGWYHKLHAEPGDDKTRFANDVAEWILARLPTKPTEDQGLASVESTSIDVTGHGSTAPWKSRL
ncbi:MAG: hypothetical protein M1833_004414 [Piccolia ochrophora]|nr:MAG: hypothetical protein M1833_004414 [Piccolia ochrophora]